MTKTILTMLAAAALTLAQQAEQKTAAEAKAQAGPREQKVFQVKYASVDYLHGAFNHIADIRTNKELKLLVVNGSPQAVKAIEDALKTLDVPPPAVRNIEVTIHLILAKPAKNGSLPAPLEAVQRNLDGLFGFKGYHLLETVFVRLRDGSQIDTSGVAPNPLDPDGVTRVNYSMRLRANLQGSDKGTMVNFDQLRLNLRVPVVAGVEGLTRKPQFQFADAGIDTRIDVREGQRVVVGKSNVNGTDGALVVVVTAKVAE